MSNKPKRPVLSPTAEESMVYPFGLPIRYRRGIATLKNNKAAGIDDVLVEQLNNLGPKPYKWLLAMFNNYFTQNKILSVPHVQTIRTIDPEQNNAYHRRTPHQETAGFRPGKSGTSQLLNLTQHIEDGYQVGMNRFCGPVSSIRPSKL